MHYILCCLFLITFLFSSGQQNIKVTSVNRPPISISNSFYTGNRKPLQQLHFIKFPAGTINPKGWILKYLQLQRDGLTGHLGEISAWLEKKDNAWFSGNGEGD